MLKKEYAAAKSDELRELDIMGSQINNSAEQDKERKHPNSDKSACNQIVVNSPRASIHKQFAVNVGSAAAVNIIRILLQLITLPLMARLLSPADFGIYAMALPTISLFMLLAEGGLGMSLAREDEGNRLLWSTAFWTLAGACSLMGVLVCGSGFVLAWISGEGVLINIMCFLAISLPLLAPTIVADARLIRRGNLIYHCGADLCGLAVGAGVGLFSAYHGGGVWSLATQYVSSLVVRAVVLNAAARTWPRFEFDFSTLSGHAANGGWLIVMRASETVGKIAENSLFGGLFGPNLLGSYTLGFQLVRFSCESVANPILSAFYSHAVRHDSSDVVGLHLFLTRLILFILIPMSVLLTILADKILPAVLGDQWSQAVLFVKILIIPYAITAASWLSGQILIRNGLSSRNAAITGVIGSLRVLSIGLGIWFSPFIVVGFLAVCYVIQAVAITFAVPTAAGADKKQLVYNFLCIFSAAVGAGLTIFVLERKLDPTVFAYVCEAVASGAIYLTIIFALQRNTVGREYKNAAAFISSIKSRFAK
ncbi:oligosaccharide flippase family protein [Methylobacterium sp. WL18]|uniref:oligosaccharide flippase family protein n=1 Tax=Methylobacterium sp. WL18 TaxID=2603897 RepID=UPI0011C91A4D|nr:oligosaccharide flippase family protein [Methylobacterium sp. WL18]TXN75915.1 oligosaccharide flippase family protein [Methylobacterium sp. WL18]